MDGWELIIAGVFYALLFIVIYLKRKKFEVIGKFLFLYRTKKANKLIEKLGAYEKFWKILGTIYVPIGFTAMIFGIVLLTANAVEIITNPQAGAGVGLLIPGVPIPGSPIYVPLFQGLIAILVLATVHEFSHAFMSIAEKVKVKATGFGFLLVLPLAFAEIDEKQLGKKPVISRLRVLSAGGGANIMTFLVLSLVIIAVTPAIAGVIEFNGVLINSMEEGYPSINSGLEEGMLIKGIDNAEINTTQSFMQELTAYSPEDNITIVTDQGNYSLILASAPYNESKGYMGVVVTQNWDFKEEAVNMLGAPLLIVIMWFRELLVWIAMLNLFVSIVNFLPIWAVDGGKMLEAFLSYYIKPKKLQKILKAVFTYTLIVLLINFLGPYLF